MTEVIEVLEEGENSGYGVDMDGLEGEASHSVDDTGCGSIMIFLASQCITRWTLNQQRGDIILQRVMLRTKYL